jgi:two-component system, LytTR family, sensor kinase
LYPSDKMKAKSNRYISIALHLLVWCLLLLLPLLLKVPTKDKGFFDYPALYFGITNLINAALFYFNAYYLAPRLLKKKQLLFYSLSVICAFVFFSFVKLLILKIGFSYIELDVWAYRFALFSTIGFIVISTLFSMAIDNVRLEREQKELLAARLSAELKFHRSQVNPHFLFNVLSSLISLGRKKSDLLEPSLIMLSELIRYMLYEANEKRVSLVKEVEYLRCYIGLQQMRFGVDVKIESTLIISDKDGELAIEPMLLIPFVENAFKHGIAGVKEPVIKLDLTVNNSTLYFNVQNKYNANHLGSTDSNSGIGLINIQSRLKLIYEGKHQLDIIKANETFYSKLKLELS